MRAVIFVNGQFHSPETARQCLLPDDYLIAADGGACHALSLGLVPHVVIGDLDSLPSETEQTLQECSAQFLRFSADKDETDLELALRHALEKGADTVMLFAALGGRLDQSLGNIMLLTLPMLKNIHVSIVDGNQRAFVIRKKAVITARPGALVSLVPLAGDAHGVSNDGFEWPLSNETLPLGASRGISNVMLAERAIISLRQGLLFCVVSSSSPVNVSSDF